MGDTLTVSMDTSKDVAEPTLEESAAKIDEQFPPQVEDRPEWLPEKFKSAEDLAKAYSELEKKLGGNKPLDAPVDDEPPAEPDSDKADTEGEDKAREAVENAGLNFDEMSTRYWESGELPEADYTALEKAGIPKQLVDQFIAGQEAILNATRQSVFSTVGGEEAYFTMTDWAGENMSKDEVATYNRAVNSGDMNMAMMAVKGLQARYAAEVGFEPQRQVTGENTKASASVYRSLAELQKDMADPRYQRDPAFRKDVENKLSRSDIM